jgi:hypothetical protein
MKTQTEYKTVKVVNKYHGLIAEGITRISIIRPSVLGNPFLLKPKSSVEERENCVQAHRRYLQEQYNTAGSLINREINELLRRLEKVDIELVCCCKPLRCHGDNIIELLQELIADPSKRV